MLIAHRVEAATADEANAIAVKSVEADDGTLGISTPPGKGCAFSGAGGIDTAVRAAIEAAILDLDDVTQPAIRQTPVNGPHTVVILPVRGVR